MSDAFTPVAAWTAHKDERDLITALMGGTKALRLAGEKYLPKEPGEDDKDYAVRLNRSVLVNQFDRTIKAAVGKVFSKPLVFQDLPEIMAGWVEDIDLEGNHLDVFARSWFRDGLAYGVSYVMIEMPRSAKPAGRRTRLDDRLEGIRPYLVHIPADRLIGWRFETINGRPKLVQARIKEDTWINDGEFGEKYVERVRILRPGSWQLFERSKGTDGKDVDTVIDQGETGLDFIPLVPFYTGRTGRFAARPPLANLADLNLRHYQSLSDQTNILRIARVPILHISRNRDATEDNDDELILGGNRAIETGPNDKISFVEHSGAAIEAGRQDLLDLMDQMEAAGMKMTPRDTTGDVTATENSLVAAEAHAALNTMAKDFQDALELALSFAARMGDVRQGQTFAEPSVIITKDFSVQASVADMQSLLQMHSDGVITKKTLLHEAKRRGVLAEDVDVVREAAEAVPVAEVQPTNAPE